MNMKLNQLAPAQGSTKAPKRVGRGIGSGRGKTSGRGHKGQKSRSGGKIAPGFEGGQMPLQMRLPKFGFTSRVGRVTAQVRTAELNRIDAEVIDLTALRSANLIKADTQRVKVMLSGEVTKAVTLKGIAVTKGARAAIEAAGGKVDAQPTKQQEKQKKQQSQQKQKLQEQQRRQKQQESQEAEEAQEAQQESQKAEEAQEAQEESQKAQQGQQENQQAQEAQEEGQQESQKAQDAQQESEQNQQQNQQDDKQDNEQQS